MRVSTKIQFIVGLFVVFVIGCFVYMSAAVGFKLGSNSKDYYTVTAKFTNINGLKQNATVKVAGITIGYIEKIDLSTEDYIPVVYLKIENKYSTIPDNSTLMVKTNGILGDKYLDLSIGFEDEGTSYLSEGSQIYNTTSTLDLEDLISKFALGN